MRIEKNSIMVLETKDIESFGMINAKEFAIITTSGEFITFGLLDLRCMYEYSMQDYLYSSSIQCLNHTTNKFGMIKFTIRAVINIFNRLDYLKYFCNKDAYLITTGIEEKDCNYSLNKYNNIINISSFSDKLSNNGKVSCLHIDQKNNRFIKTLTKVLDSKSKYSCEFLNFLSPDDIVIGTLTFIRRNNIIVISSQVRDGEYIEFKFTEDSIAKFVHAVETGSEKIIL